jgi:hypothetical protein
LTEETDEQRSNEATEHERKRRLMFFSVWTDEYTEVPNRIFDSCNIDPKPA